MMTKQKTDAPVRSVTSELEVPGTPEQVWEAIATGPGITAWFTPADVEPRLGGAVTFHWGPGMDSQAVVTAWEPPQRVTWEDKNWVEGAPPIATEIQVEARSGGTCLVRIVTSLFGSSAEWDDQLEGMERGWPGFLFMLKLHLAHFRGQPCTNVRIGGPRQGSEDEVWAAFTRDLGLAGAVLGQQRDTSAAGAPALAGLVERVTGHEVVLRTTKPAPGCALVATYDCGGTVERSVNLFLYGPDAPEVAAREVAAWRAWMDR
jgi:uncharacterized protein YndB with AHSA1/START domain